MLCVIVLVAENGEFYRFEGFCVGRLPERIVDRQGKKARFRPVQRRADFHQENRIAQPSNPATGKPKARGFFSNHYIKIGPKLEAPDLKYYREIQQSKLDRTVAGIPCAGLHQPHTNKKREKSPANLLLVLCATS